VNFLGQEGVLLLAIYIVKNTRVLQTMKIYCSDELKLEREFYPYVQGPLQHLKLLFNTYLSSTSIYFSCEYGRTWNQNISGAQFFY